MQTAERAKAAAKPITAAQHRVLEYIKDHIRDKGYPPSNREIAEGTGHASSSTIHGHLNRLEDKGYIRRDPTKPRALEVVGEPTSAEAENATLRERNKQLEEENARLRGLLEGNGEPID